MHYMSLFDLPIKKQHGKFLRLLWPWLSTLNPKIYTGHLIFRMGINSGMATTKPEKKWIGQKCDSEIFSGGNNNNTKLTKNWTKQKPDKIEMKKNWEMLKNKMQFANPEGKGPLFRGPLSPFRGPLFFPQVSIHIPPAGGIIARMGDSLPHSPDKPGNHPSSTAMNHVVKK